MTMTDVFEVVNLLGGAKSDPHGVSWGPLRVERGSGIAGRGDVWAITFPGHHEVKPICGLRTKVQLRDALRKLVIRSCRAMLAAHEAKNLLIACIEMTEES